MTDKKLNKPQVRSIINSLHDAIVDLEDYEDNPEWLMQHHVEDYCKTKKMLSLEARIDMPIQTLLRREDYCGRKVRPSNCMRRSTACLFHGYGLSPSIVEQWRRRLGMVKHKSKVVNDLLENLQKLSAIAEEKKQVRVPVIYTRRQIKAMIQALVSMPSDMEIED